ncbi:MAG: DUF4192 family protein, partial [Actinomycetales bacterium]|nr:DUF4192 family protein [Actinomycetales bacterium]
MDGDQIATINRLDWSKDPIVLPDGVISILRNLADPSVVLLAYQNSDLTLDALTDLVPSVKEFSLLDALQVTDEVWRSLMCKDSDCCPPAGHALADLKGTDFDFVLNGSAPFASREDLATRLETRSLSEEQLALRDQALIQVSQEFDQQMIDESDSVSVRAEYLDRLMGIWIGESLGEWQDLALLTQIASNIHTRDGLLRQMFDRPELRLKMRTTLIDAVSKSKEVDVASLATLLAGCAWLDGNGALASIALEKALSADPSYSLARLLDRAISNNVPPSVWTDSLAAVSYDECLAGAA